MACKRGLVATSRIARHSTIVPSVNRTQFSTFRSLKAEAEVNDPDMNGGYINPPAIKRTFRDPYGNWTHPQERKNFGEPVHEDNDILGVFSLEEYTHMTPARGALLWAGFISCVLGLSYAVYSTYPDRPSAPKEYPDALEAELGGPGGKLARTSANNGL